mgnify:CR=1 FL=1
MTFPDIAVINNVLCVENEAQLKNRLIKNTKSNAKGMLRLIKEKRLANQKELLGGLGDTGAFAAKGVLQQRLGEQRFERQKELRQMGGGGSGDGTYRTKFGESD